MPAKDKLSDLVWQYRDYLLDIAEAEEAAKIAQLMEGCRRAGAVGNKGALKAWGSAERKRAVAELLRDLRKRIEVAQDEFGDPPGELDQLTAEMLPLWRQLLQRVQTVYRERKRLNTQLDFDDLERLAAELLRDHLVQARYRGAEFNHLLVDEFQDTNQAQWQIIRALADLEHGGSLFVVGDPKQSIYQFRGADVSVFNQVRDQIAGHDAGRALPLSTSFRSHQRLLAQFNALFKKILTRDDTSPVADFEVIYDTPMDAFRLDSPVAPAIELQLLDYVERDKNGDYVEDARGRKQRYPAEDMRRWEAYELAKRIKFLIADKRHVFDKDCGKWRGIKFGDIAILFQSLTQVNIYEDVFKSQDIPFLTIAGRGYYDRQEVWDMLDLLRFTHNPADNLSLATVLRSPMFAFSDNLLFALRLVKDAQGAQTLTLWRALEIAAAEPVKGIEANDQPVLRHALETLGDLQGIAGRVTISELLRRALERTNYLAILTGLPDGARRRGNIEKLLGLAEDSGKVTVGKFSQYLADLSAREVREGEALLEAGNAVRLMTVHASKGLEFPLVILADASWERGNLGAPTLLVDPDFGLSCQVYDAEENRYVSGFAHRRNLKLSALKEAAERKRLLYVAATRAQDYLLISGQVSQSKDTRWVSRGWLRQLIDSLEIDGIEREEAQCSRFAGQDIEVRMPAHPPPPQALDQSAKQVADLWDLEATQRDFEPLQPSLMRPIPQSVTASPSHISVTQIADLGNWRYESDARRRSAFGRRFREGALHDMPAYVRDLRLDQTRIPANMIGDIVHELLRFSNFSHAPANRDEMIKSIAWQRGITNGDALASAVSEVRALLAQYRDSEVSQWVQRAREYGRPLYTELPFILRTDRRVIHGVMDVLLRLAGGDWAVIDYKTSIVADGDFTGHARRYHLQLGVYAAAAAEQLRLEHLPRTFVHYIRGNHTVSVSSAECKDELERLESTIGAVMTSDA